MNIFDILGPVMVGPSSSHTAGAVRIGLISRKLLGEEPAKAEILLHGSFAATGVGHGTDRALVAGLLGMEPDDSRIPVSFDEAKKAGLDFSIAHQELRGAHPNTARLSLTGKDGAAVTVQASSIGGGRIRVDELDGIAVNFSGEKSTLIVPHLDRQGLLAEVSSLISFSRGNIASLQLFREKRGGTAVMVIELDNPLPAEAVRMVERLPGVLRAVYLNFDG